MAIKRSRNVNIPLDITLEILKKLPAKSLMRFLCVSKQWKSIIRDFIVINSIVTGSLTQPPREPHFILSKSSSSRPLSFWYTYPNGQKLYHEKCFGTSKTDTAEFQYVRGLIGFRSSYYGKFKIHNPTTSQTVSLPNVTLSGRCVYLFGYDPLENQYKILCALSYPRSWQVFTLGDPKKQWKNIQCSIGDHFPYEHAVCINGKLYYEAYAEEDSIWASFDVRSEKFNNLQAPEELKAHFSTLVNYQGKLGCICWNMRNKDVDFWVMEDANNQEWSKITFVSMIQELPSHMIIISGVTHPGGEIVIVRNIYSNAIPLEINYYDPKRKTRRSFEIKTTKLTGFVRVWPVTDHVENTMPL